PPRRTDQWATHAGLARSTRSMGTGRGLRPPVRVAFTTLSGPRGAMSPIAPRWPLVVRGDVSPSSPTGATRPPWAALASDLATGATGRGRAPGWRPGPSERLDRGVLARDLLALGDVRRLGSAAALRLRRRSLVRYGRYARFRG